jgi:uncharacterized protein YndB with AHSA1/START domain
MTQAQAAVVRNHVVVEAPTARAFSVFSERFGDFKPPEHNLLGVAIAEIVFEARVGGHIYDRGVDGSECRWARILAYEPPARVVFSWEISPQWQLETEPENASAVEVRFIAEGPQRTRLELEHRHIDRHGPGWQAVRDGVAGDAGWPSTSTGTQPCSPRAADSSPPRQHRNQSSWVTEPASASAASKGLVGASRAGVHSRGGETADLIEQVRLGVMGEIVDLGHGQVRWHRDIDFGAQRVPDPADSQVPHASPRRW